MSTETLQKSSGRARLPSSITDLMHARRACGYGVAQLTLHLVRSTCSFQVCKTKNWVRVVSESNRIQIQPYPDPTLQYPEPTLSRSDLIRIQHYHYLHPTLLVSNLILVQPFRIRPSFDPILSGSDLIHIRHYPHPTRVGHCVLSHSERADLNWIQPYQDPTLFGSNHIRIQPYLGSF